MAASRASVENMNVSRACAVLVFALGIVTGTGAPAAAQGFDLTVFAGLAYPLYDERLTVQPGELSIPGVEVTPVISPELTGDGGAVFGASLTFEFGILGIEGRIDSVDAAIDFTGARYDLRGTSFPFQGVTASLVAAAGRFEADRFSILSANLRLRTPGPVGIVASGGMSYLPDITVSGSVPLSIQSPQLPPLGFDAGLTLRALPGQSGHRFGVNGGIGLRVGGRVGVMGEVRGFYFREYELRFATLNGPELVDALLADADPIGFEPVFVNAQIGISFKF